MKISKAEAVTALVSIIGIVGLGLVLFSVASVLNDKLHNEGNNSTERTYSTSFEPITGTVTFRQDPPERKAVNVIEPAPPFTPATINELRVDEDLLNSEAFVEHGLFSPTLDNFENVWALVDVVQPRRSAAVHELMETEGIREEFPLLWNELYEAVARIDEPVRASEVIPPPPDGHFAKLFEDEEIRTTFLSMTELSTVDTFLSSKSISKDEKKVALDGLNDWAHRNGLNLFEVHEALDESEQLASLVVFRRVEAMKQALWSRADFISSYPWHSILYRAKLQASKRGTEDE